MGDAIGASHATVERIEKGETLPSMAHVRGWLTLAAQKGALEPGERQRILDLAEAVHAETRGWSDLLSQGHAQEEIGRREQAATRVRNYQDEIAPGLLQTPEYARAFFELGRTTDIDGAVAKRIARQKILREPGRRFDFLIRERALSWPLGGVDVVMEQRDRILSLARLETVTVAVLPADVVVAVPFHNFTLWDTPDGPYAMAELVWGQPEKTEPDDLARLNTLWATLWAAALHGDEALELIRSLP